MPELVLISPKAVVPPPAMRIARLRSQWLAGTLDLEIKETDTGLERLILDLRPQSASQTG